MAGFPSARAWNDCVTTVNCLRNINLGPGLSGSATATGICIDAKSAAVGSTFPYGSKWAFGIGIELGQDTTVTIYNPVIDKVGVLVSDWFGIAGTICTPFPDPKEYELVLDHEKWARNGVVARTLIYMSYDQTNNAIEILQAGTPSAGSTLPTDDGGGAYDAARYIKTPLYVLSGVYVEDEDNGDSVVSASVYMDLIHGHMSCPVMG
jgi:hypothetical protein